MKMPIYTLILIIYTLLLLRGTIISSICIRMHPYVFMCIRHASRLQPQAPILLHRASERQYSTHVSHNKNTEIKTARLLLRLEPRNRSNPPSIATQPEIGKPLSVNSALKPARPYRPYRPAGRPYRPPARPAALEHGLPPEGGNVILDEFFK